VEVEVEVEVEVGVVAGGGAWALCRVEMEGVGVGEACLLPFPCACSSSSKANYCPQTPPLGKMGGAVVEGGGEREWKRCGEEGRPPISPPYHLSSSSSRELVGEGGPLPPLPPLPLTPLLTTSTSNCNSSKGWVVGGGV
jgi:hypothetical protein